MANVKNSKRSDKRSVLIIAKRNKKTKKLAHLLVDFFNEIRLISVLEEIEMVISSNSFTAIVVTDSLGFELNRDILLNLKKRFSGAKILCLADKISQKKEAALRSAGPVFLGSYDHFFDFSEDILSAAIASKKRTKF
jgi:Holliday junction resolvasome RuvABC ATP-dependent DNA helicase subunit